MLRLIPVLLLSATAMSLPQADREQLTFSAPSVLPALVEANFPGHTLIPLLDGTFLPSPSFGVGTAWFNNDGNETTEAVLSALKVGYRHLDNAAIYGNEGAVGRAIAQAGLKREEIYITTKYDNIDGESVEDEFEKSLLKLGVEYIDLYLIHFPRFAPNLPSVWASFQKLQAAGKIRSIGLSNYPPALIKTLNLLPTTVSPPVVNQIRYHPYNTIENENILKYAGETGLVLQAYSGLTPLTKETGGPLDPIVKEIAENKGWTDGQVILSWIKQRGIQVVTTSGKEFRQREQLDVFGPDFGELSEVELTAIDAAGEKGEKEKK